MAGFDTRRLTAAAFGIALVLGAGCPDPGSSCTGCTIKKVTYTIEPLPEGASINSIAMVEHIEMTGHCYDGSGTQPCVYTNTKVVNPTPTAAGSGRATRPTCPRPAGTRSACRTPRTRTGRPTCR